MAFPQPAMQGTQQMDYPDSRETFGSLSHTDSLERLVKRGPRETKEKVRDWQGSSAKKPSRNFLSSFQRP